MSNGMTNGFSIKSLSDVTAMILIVTFLISGLTWGMKLEARYDSVDHDIAEIKSTLGALEKSLANDRRIRLLEDTILNGNRYRGGRVQLEELPDD